MPGSYARVADVSHSQLSRYLEAHDGFRSGFASRAHTRGYRAEHDGGVLNSDPDHIDPAGDVANLIEDKLADADAQETFAS